MITIINPQRRKKIKLDSYAGEWVAFVGDKIVAHNKNLKDLMKEIDAKGLRKKASILLVPRKDEGPYV
jgi:dihydroxyacetone kinase-like predicted kinase